MYLKTYIIWDWLPAFYGRRMIGTGIETISILLESSRGDEKKDYEAGVKRPDRSQNY